MDTPLHRMDPATRNRWTQALRSGDYRRSNGVMRQDIDGEPCFCVFGVLLETMQTGAWDCNDDETRVAGREVVTYTHVMEDGTLSRGAPPESVRQRWRIPDLAISRLTSMNDVGATFKQMARWIEVHL